MRKKNISITPNTIRKVYENINLISTDYEGNARENAAKE
jgi:hypothetical protein